MEKKPKQVAPPISQEERNKRRAEAKLPILASYQVFIDRLKTEKSLVVIAETGSGKTTQLPQVSGGREQERETERVAQSRARETEESEGDR